MEGKVEARLSGVHARQESSPHSPVGTQLAASLQREQHRHTNRAELLTSAQRCRSCTYCPPCTAAQAAAPASPGCAAAAARQAASQAAVRSTDLAARSVRESEGTSSERATHTSGCRAATASTYRSGVTVAAPVGTVTALVRLGGQWCRLRTCSGCTGAVDVMVQQATANVPPVPSETGATQHAAMPLRNSQAHPTTNTPEAHSLVACRMAPAYS